ncbi:unnamed protein product [Mytilus coruscus]|uniref:Fucolectin tachylectin-4 pentraxin-1 domain-containing protein n=1 Tax=Mytilus coruscus TaxID=42192 RepID=A0A6J8E790_MYTCO|nr:unnamed protein product [Mytilus coruscus]
MSLQRWKFLCYLSTLPCIVASLKSNQQAFSIKINKIILSHQTSSLDSSIIACAVVCIFDYNCCSASYNEDSTICLLGIHCSPEMEDSADFKTLIKKPRDVAYGKSAKQSSVFDNRIINIASRAVDGDLNTWMHTERENEPFWIVDLEKIYKIKRIEIFNRNKGFKRSGERLHDLDITVGPTENEMKLCAHYVGPAKLGDHLEFECLHEDIRYVKLMINGTEVLNVVEVKVYAWILTSVLYEENETQVEEEPDSFRSAFDVLAKEVQQNIIHGLQVSNLTDLCSRFKELLVIQGVHVLNYNPTRLKARLVNKFGDNLTFWRSDRQNSLLVFCSSVPTGQIVQTAIESSTLVQSNNTLNVAVGKEDIVTTIFYAAKAIRNVISLDLKSNIPWPPTGESISENNIVIPDLLYNFLALLLTDDSKHASFSPSKLDISSEVLHRRIMSLAQDLIYSVSKGYTKTPKHVALAIYLKTQTGSSEIVKIINKFGHSVSYDQAEEIETSIAEQMIMNTEDDIFIPSNIRKGVFSSFCWDNNDLCEEKLSGQGTTHCTNGIVIQTRPDWCENEDEANQPPLQRSKNRSLKILTEEQPVHFYSKPRVGPKTNFSKQTHNSFQSLSLVSRKKDFCFLLCRMSLLDNLFLLENVSQCIPAWTAFNIMTNHTNVPRANSIGCLQVIHESPTDLNTVTTVLQRSVSIADKLGQRDVVIVFDQAICAKALEIIWQKPVEFERVVLRMGAFHTACAFIAVIGKRFGDAGLGDLLLESGVIGSGSLTGVFKGKHYNRALRLHKIVFEAFERLHWEAFGSWLNSNDENEFLDSNFQASVLHCWTNPFETSEQLSVLSSGTVASSEFLCDLLNAYEKGKLASENFIIERIIQKSTDIFKPIKRQSLLTFSTKEIKGYQLMADKNNTLKADRNLFGRLLVIAQTRQLDMQEVLQFELGPLPWSLANVDGTPVKTNKSVLAGLLEKGVEQMQANLRKACGYLMAWQSFNPLLGYQVLFLIWQLLF